MRALLVALALLAVGAPAVAAAEPWDRYRVASPKSTLNRLNTLRASIGAPRVTEVPAWSTGCAKHMLYSSKNPLGHYEDPSRPGYTPDGAEAGSRSVLSWPADEPFRRGAPLGIWAQAPYHQLQVLDPMLRQTGFSKGCLNTIAGLTDAYVDEAVIVPPKLYAWPGEGAKAVPRSVNACNERPSDPFTAVGWSCGGVGTAMYVYAIDEASGGCAVTEGVPAVSVIAKGASVPLAVVEGGYCSWVVVTGRPLPRNARVRMDVSFAGSALTHRFSTVAPKPKRRPRSH